ncbi:MAG TPA: hypothetical protein VNN25_22985 [Thermoanaerobaculia bacterium]|nr:hypothetical protein [Thermoanaerobaculia bacterium]
MNYPRIVLATLGSTVVYFMLGGLLFAATPLTDEFRKYPAVYRTPESMKGVIPFGIVGMLLSMAALSVLYALVYRGGRGLAEGARFGMLVGAFAVGSFVLHNYVNLNIGLKLTVEQAVAYFIQWTVTGIVIGLIYKAPA